MSRMLTSRNNMLLGYAFLDKVELYCCKKFILQRTYSE